MLCLVRRQSQYCSKSHLLVHCTVDLQSETVFSPRSWWRPAPSASLSSPPPPSASLGTFLAVASGVGLGVALLAVAFLAVGFGRWLLGCRPASQKQHIQSDTVTCKAICTLACAMSAARSTSQCVVRDRWRRRDEHENVSLWGGTRRHA